jgi:uncharacterized protein YraI
MRPRFLLAAIALLGAIAGPGVAAAQSIAYTIPYSTTNMRAGPGLDYPVVAVIRGGSPVTVFGCVSDFSWCDSIVQNIRGWISTTRLEFDYGGNLVPIPRYYTYFRAPIISFDFGYWDRYYSDRPFYRERHHRRHDRRYYNSDAGNPSDEGSGHRRQSQERQHFSDGGGGSTQGDGGGHKRRQRQHFSQGDAGGGGGGGDAKPRHHRRNAGGNQSGDSGAPCVPTKKRDCR